MRPPRSLRDRTETQLTGVAYGALQATGLAARETASLILELQEQSGLPYPSFHFGGAQSNPYLLKIVFNVPSAPSVASAAFIFSSNSWFPFRTANAALGLGDEDW